MKVAITGSTGFIGKKLTESLAMAGHDILPITRRHIEAPHVLWDVKAETIDLDALNNAQVDAVIHLAGEGIAEKRWTQDQKKEILESRAKGTRLIAQSIAQLEKKPSIFISASAIGYYGDRPNEILDETSSAGDNFQSEVCIEWEANQEPAKKAGIASATIRTGLVLDKTGGTLKRLLLPFKLGLGGKIGDGKQYMSWISLEDEIRAITFILENKLQGIFNLVAPEPVTNAEFTRTLGARLSRPTLIPTPLFALKAIYGSELVEELLLSSARVIPKALEATGFVFQHRQLSQALDEVV